MNLNNIFPLSDIAVYDAESGEIILQIDRITVSLSLEEFALVTNEFEKASKSMAELMTTTVQKINYDQEIN